MAAWEEKRSRSGKTHEPRGISLDGKRETLAHDEPFVGKPDGRVHHIGPRQASVLVVHFKHPRNGTGHAGSKVSGNGAVSHFSILVQIHVAPCRKRRLLAEVESGRGAVGQPEHQESPAADVPRLRHGHGQSESSGNRRVDRIPPVSHDLNTGVRCKRVVARDNAPGRCDRKRLGVKRPCPLRSGRFFIASATDESEYNCEQTEDF